ncbi:unnamed protein product [Phytophthora fragariaefolia]|uniref:Unnamed protein product n=1 Tax=Phytophthora fragariaefolia TaxID=1490495 RepID=A0A9W6XS50_9STRA|nr:unnamed protein product [Phytophthora fragariaefolia]
MRRMSTTAAAPARASRLSLARAFQQQPIGECTWPQDADADDADSPTSAWPEELPELRSILAVQNLVAKIPEQPAPRHLSEGGAYRQWLDDYRRSNALGAETQLDKDAFAAFAKEAGEYLQRQEDEAFQGCDKIRPLEDEELASPEAEAFVEAVKVKLARHMLSQAAASFELLDKDKDGGFAPLGGCVARRAFVTNAVLRMWSWGE